jgi:hypothetical protein
MIVLVEGEARIILPKGTLSLCESFTDKVIGSSLEHYKGRGQENVWHIRQQIIQGKMAEVAVSHFYSTLGLPITPPDFEIYESKDKSYSPDLVLCESVHLHVKSCSREVAQLYGISFVFQKNDPIVRSNAKDQWIALTRIDNNEHVTFFGCIHPHLATFSDMKKISLNKSKLALYLKEQCLFDLSFFPLP